MILKVLKIPVCATIFIYTFYVLCKLTYFFSKPREYEKSFESNQEEDWIQGTVWLILINISLISAFILQHSVMATDFVKSFYRKYNIEDMERSIFNLSSSAILHYLILEWKPIPWAIWKFDVTENSVVWITSTFFQTVGWCIVYCGCCMMDLSELAGLKQVYYSVSGRPHPMTVKSQELQRFFMHMRHPSFTGFFIILWAYPIMSIDRLLLASILSVYMILMWTVDLNDYNYHCTVISKKQRELREFSLRR